MGVSHSSGQTIDHSIDHVAMPGALNLLDVFELVVNGFDDGALTQQQLIDQGHQFVAHVPANFGDQL